MVKISVKTPSEGAEQKEYNYEFDQPVITIGRLKENDIQLPLSTVSGYHAQILNEEDTYYVLDRGSINGTFLNQQRLPPGEKKLVQDGDVITIQDCQMYFLTGAGAEGANQGATMQMARQMVMDILGSWETQQKPSIIVVGGPDNGKQIELTEGTQIIVGRGSQADVTIDHPTISRRHGEISFSWNGAYIKDMESPNGIFVNDVRIQGSYRLRDRDEIRMGQANNPEAIRLVFSNPAEALLSKIEEEQITDVDSESPPGEAGADSGTAPPDVPPPLPEEGPSEQEQTPEPAVEEAEEAEAPPVEPATPEKKRSLLFPVLLAVSIIVVLGVAAVVGFFVIAGRDIATVEQATPPRGAPADLITIAGDSLRANEVQNVYLLGKNAPISTRDEHSIQIRIPAFPNLEPGERNATITLEGESGQVASASFTLVVVPEITSIQPISGRAGTEVRIEADTSLSSAKVLIGGSPAKIETISGNQVTVRVPVGTEAIPDSGKVVPVAIEIAGVRSSGKTEFTILPTVILRSMQPEAGSGGTEVRLIVDGDTSDLSVYFGQSQAVVRKKSDSEITVLAPVPSQPVPDSGLNLPVTLRAGNITVPTKASFTVLPEVEEVFELTFTAKPYRSTLGFNEYAVETNIGPLLVLVAKDEYGSSRVRAEAVAVKLKQAADQFSKDPAARIALQREGGGFSLSATGQTGRVHIVRVFPDDALAYGKINRRVISLDELAEWWKMLIESYLKVFVQVESPAPTGILSAGGNILQQVYSFYGLKGSEGQRYYRKDFLNSLQADQKQRLQNLSMTLPRKLASVDGKWSGRISNILYSNISDDTLELMLNLQQKPDGTVTGRADLNWKVGVGSSTGGFQNTIFKKLGTHKLSGFYDKTQSVPLQFSFVEKDGRRLDFVGKLEGETLTGSFVAGNEKGTWNVRLR